MQDDDRERRNQILAGAAICGAVAVISVSIRLGWRSVPGVFGEWLGTMAGILSTPFFLEISFFLIGVAIVSAINHWRRTREGDEYVYLEQVDGPGLPADLPEHARWAIYENQPLPGEEPSLLSAAEGALAIGDHQAAAGFISGMSPAELKQPATLAVRLELARASGNLPLAERLENEIAAGGAQNS